MENPGIKLGLRLLKICGINIYNNSKLPHFLIIVYTILIFTTFALCTLEPILNFQNITELAKSVEAISNHFMVLSRLIIFKKNFYAIRELINFKAFWPMNHCGEILKNKQMTVYNAVIKVYKFMLPFIISVNVGSYIIAPFVSRHLPNPSYQVVDFMQSPVYEIVCIWQTINGYILTFFVVGFDCIFLSNLALGYCQMIMLKHELRGLKMLSPDIILEEVNYYGKIIKLIIHHTDILLYFDKLNKIYSPILLTELMSSFLNICTSLYLTALYKDSEIEMNLRFSAIIGIYAWILLVFCVAGTMVTSQYSSISISIYESQWYLGPSKSPRIRKAIMLLMQQCQKKLQIKAGEIFTLDIDTYSVILRTSYSFYTLLISIS